MAKLKTGQQVKPLSALEITTFSLGALSRELCNNCIGAFILVYLSIYMHLNPLIMSTAFMVARVIDAFGNPLIATFINNSKKSKFGHYRPWILGGVLVCSVLTVCMFIPLQTANVIKYIYYITMFVLWEVSFSIFDVPYWSMLPTIANTTEERNKVSSFAKLVGGFGAFMITTIGTSFILPKYAQEGMEKAYLIIGAVGGALTLFFMLFVVFGNREKHDLPNDRIEIKHIFKIFKQNDQLRAFSGNFALFMGGSTIATYQLLYLYVYCYENAADYFRSSFSFTMFWVIACTAQGFAMVFYNQLTKKIPREKMFSMSLILAIIGYALMFSIFFFLKPANGDITVYWLNTVLFSLCASFLMLAIGIFQIGSMVMIADVVDYGEWKTGVRGDSVIFSIQILLIKLSAAAALLVLGVGISLSGLPKVQEVLNPETGGTIQRFVDSLGNPVNFAASAGALTTMRAFMFLIPIPMSIAAYIIYKKKYWLVGEKYSKIKREIDERRAAKEEETDAKNQL